MADENKTDATETPEAGARSGAAGRRAAPNAGRGAGG